MFGMKIVFNSVLFYGLFVGTDSVFSNTGFVNNFLNDWNCRLNLMAKVDGSDSIIESYFNKSGDPCKIYCRVRSIVSPTVQFFTLNAPEFRICGHFQFCHNGECGPCLFKRIAANSFRVLSTAINRNLNMSSNEGKDAKFEPRIEREEKPKETPPNPTNHHADPRKLTIERENMQINHQAVRPFSNFIHGPKARQGENFDWERVLPGIKNK